MGFGNESIKKLVQVRRSGQLQYHQIKWPSSLVAVPNDLPLPPASFSALRNYKLVAIPGALSSKARGPSSVLYDSKP